MSKTVEADAESIRARIAELVSTAEEVKLSPAARRKVDATLRRLIADLEAALGRLDPVTMPLAVFDPSNPKIIGRFTALALLAQERVPLSAVPAFYGSGVYAIYYRGDYPLYAPIRDTETPIYVGQAAPAERNARSARDQGERLAARLNEHRKNIAKAESSLSLGDFEARYLVVQSGWETAAEDYLIHLFRPLWNNETKLVFGLGKHGDAATTRANKRSPWDTLHPGRKWAEATLEDSRSPEQLDREVEEHFRRHAPVRDQGALLEAFFMELRQA